MTNKKFKTRDEWKKLVLKLSDQEFEELCYDVLQKNNFQNVKPRGKGADGGRDIEAEFIQAIGKEKITQKIWIQCKRYGTTPLNYKSFSTEVTQAQTDGVDRFIVMSNKDMTSDTQTAIEKWNKINKCQISDWTGSRFIDMLWEIPNICQIYFPDEEIPPIVDQKKPEEAIVHSKDLGKRFGITLEIKISGSANMNNPSEVAELIKKSLIETKFDDVNIKSMIFSKISMLFFNLGKQDDALMFLQRSLEITPKNPEALLNKGFILEKIDELSESTKCYDLILDMDSNNKLALNNKAHNLRRQGMLKEALRAIDKALEQDSKFITAIQTKIEILRLMGKSEDAINFIEEQDETYKKSLILQQTVVRLYIDVLDLKKAYNLNEEILKENHNDINSINDKGVIYENNSRFQNKEKYLGLAYNCFEETKKIDQNFPLGWSNSTVVLLNAGKLDDAESIIEIAYAFFPKNAYILNKKGLVLFRKGHPNNALNYFNSALKLQYQEEFVINRAECYLVLRQWKKSLNDCDNVLENNSKNANAWRIKAEAQRKLHETTKSKMSIKQAEKYTKKPISLLEDKKDE